jgi:hypothetical protein
VHVSYIDGGALTFPSDQLILKAPGNSRQSLDWFDQAHRLAP